MPKIGAETGPSYEPGLPPPEGPQNPADALRNRGKLGPYSDIDPASQPPGVTPPGHLELDEEGAAIEPDSVAQEDPVANEGPPDERAEQPDKPPGQPSRSAEATDQPTDQPDTDQADQPTGQPDAQPDQAPDATQGETQGPLPPDSPLNPAPYPNQDPNPAGQPVQPNADADVQPGINPTDADPAGEGAMGAGTATGPDATGSDPGVSKPAWTENEAPDRPPQSATKGEWVSYAAAVSGQPEETLAECTKAELIEQYGG